MKRVYELEDGRPFIPDTAIRLEPELIEMLRLDEPQNFWGRHECLSGWVGPKPEARHGRN